MESGEYGWLDYVNHFSPEWQEEYTDYCNDNGIAINEQSAEAFVHYKNVQLEEAIEKGDDIIHIGFSLLRKGQPKSTTLFSTLTVREV